MVFFGGASNSRTRDSSLIADRAGRSGGDRERVWIGDPELASVQETEAERFRRLDQWIGWSRVAGTSAVVATYAVLWWWHGDHRRLGWVIVAAFSLLHSSMWLLGMRRPFNRVRRDLQLRWMLVGDAVLIGLAGHVTALPYSAWMPLWCAVTASYVGRLGRRAAYAVLPVAALEGVIYNLTTGRGVVDPSEWARQGIIFACIVILTWLVALVHEQDQALRRRLNSLAVRDGLTGLYNHRFFAESLEREFSRLQREPGELSVLMIDIDRFKRVNDSAGHVAGDEVLRVVASLLTANVRTHDLVFRYGGEEFAVILPRSGAAAAAGVAERAAARIREHPFPYGRVTVSIGWSSYPSSAADPAQLVKQADIALYHAKESGRDRVMGYADVERRGKGVV